METFILRKILCPVDFSSHSELALRTAGEFAAAFDAELIILHAQRFEPPLYFTASQTAALRAQLRRGLRAARKFLEDFAEKQLPAGVSRSYEIIEADPAPAILDAAKKSAAGLIVMGTHGRTGLTKIRLGSVTETVLRQVMIPIATLGPHVAPLPAGRRTHRILCPVDYSELARTAFGYAVTLAQRFGAELVITHVVEDESSVGPASEALCDWVPADIRQQCSINEIIRYGEPAAQILEELKRSGADLLVIGAAPRSALEAALFGSTTEMLIRNAPSPVLSVIRKPKKAVVAVNNADDSRQESATLI
jgi:nucleotide-binding universal stress UspA family protein